MEIPEITEFSSIYDVLDFAIKREAKANSFYLRIADMAQNPELLDILKDFAEDELRHKTMLEALKAGKIEIPEEKLGNLNMANYVPDVDPHPNMTYTELLALAIKKEDLSYRLYTDLAELAQTKELKDAFLKLSQQEAKHKLRFEVEFDLESF